MSRGDVHRLRVLTRRLRAAEWLVRHEYGAPALGRLRKSLRQVARALGHRRTLDVVSRDAHHYGIDSARLKPLVQVAESDLRRALGKSRRKKLERDLCRAAEHLDGMPRWALVPALDLLQQRLERLRGATASTPEEGHRIRIEAKKIRYALEALGRRVDALVELQSHLGRGHDLRVLQQFLGADPEVRRLEREEWRKARGLLRPAVEAALGELDRLREELAA